MPLEDARERPRELLVSGHVNVDRFLSVTAFPGPDRTVPIRSVRAELGGTATNLALVASSYGVASGLVSALGTEFPPAFLDRLRAAHIDLRGVRTFRRVSTPTCYTVVDAQGDQRTLIDQGPMRDLSRAALPGAWMREYSWVHLTTGDPAFQLRLARKARGLGLKVAADPAQEIHYRWDRARLSELLASSELLFGNRSEVERACGYLGVGSPRDLLAFVPLIVRTEGHRGVTAFSRDGNVHVPAERRRTPGHAVGAGDAFRGGFYAGWFGGQPLDACLRAGVHASARWLDGER